MLGVSIGNGRLAGISPLGKVKVEGRKIFGTTIRHDAERVDECRQRADECQRNAGQLVGDERASRSVPRKSEFDWHPYAFAGGTGVAFAFALSIIGAWFVH